MCYQIFYKVNSTDAIDKIKSHCRMKFLFFSHPSVTGVVLYYLLAQAGAVDMGIYLGRSDALMPEHCLNHAQIGTALEQMRCKRVTEGMRTHILLYSSLMYQLFDKMEHHYARKAFLQSLANKNIVFVARLYRYHIPVEEVCFKLSYGA